MGISNEKSSFEAFEERQKASREIYLAQIKEQHKEIKEQHLKYKQHLRIAHQQAVARWPYINLHPNTR